LFFVQDALGCFIGPTMIVSLCLSLYHDSSRNTTNLYYLQIIECIIKAKFRPGKGKEKRKKAMNMLVFSLKIG